MERLPSPRPGSPWLVSARPEPSPAEPLWLPLSLSRPSPGPSSSASPRSPQPAWRASRRWPSLRELRCTPCVAIVAVLTLTGSVSAAEAFRSPARTSLAAPAVSAAAAVSASASAVIGMGDARAAPAPNAAPNAATPPSRAERSAQSSAQAGAQSGAQTLVDRIVAIVGDQVITLSDVRIAQDFGLLDLAPGTPPPTEAQIVERLVERELMRAEVERFGAGEPAAADLDARTDAIRARFGSLAAFRDALEAHGLSEARFRAWLADDARIGQHIQQRFGISSQPTEEEMLQYYQSREREFAVDGRPRPFSEVRDLVQLRLGATRRQAMVDDWVAGLRRRTAVVLKTID